jgi:hypothetical protein
MEECIHKDMRGFCRGNDCFGESGDVGGIGYRKVLRRGVNQGQRRTKGGIDLKGVFLPCYKSR